MMNDDNSEKGPCGKNKGARAINFCYAMKSLK